MNPFGRTLDFLRRGVGAGGVAEPALRAWRQLPEADLAQRHAETRYVVVDVETTGLDMRRDRVIAIGAVAIVGGRIPLGDCFETVLRQDQASSSANILIHGIGGQTQLFGVEPRAGLLDLLAFVRKDPLVAFRAEFDQTMLERAWRSTLDAPIRRRWIDLAFLLPALFPQTECQTLDDWLLNFGLSGGERHHAVADAYATAQLLQIALVAANGHAMTTAAQLLATQKAQRWLGKRH